MMAGDRERIWNDMKWYGRDRGDGNAWSVGSILFPKVIMEKKSSAILNVVYYDTL